jgi:hypothetical protein
MLDCMWPFTCGIHLGGKSGSLSGVAVISFTRVTPFATRTVTGQTSLSVTVCTACPCLVFVTPNALGGSDVAVNGTDVVATAGATSNNIPNRTRRTPHASASTPVA